MLEKCFFKLCTMSRCALSLPMILLKSSCRKDFFGGGGFWLKIKNTLETLIAEEVRMYLKKKRSSDDEKGAIIPLVDTKLVHAGGVAHFQLNYPSEDSIT